jgi:putative glycosyl hydrolase-like family 15 (GHL15) protein
MTLLASVLGARGVRGGSSVHATFVPSSFLGDAGGWYETAVEDHEYRFPVSRDTPRPPAPLRRARRLTFALGLAGVAIVAAAGATGPAAAPRQPATGALRICSGCSKHGLTDGSRYQYVIIHAWQSRLIARLKAKNPGIKVLVYKDLAATVAYSCHKGVDDRLLPAGVGYCWAKRNHPGWFLRDQSGAPIEFCDYRKVWQMDVGSPGYQRRWLSRVATEAKRLEFDGVMLDDANQSESTHLCGKKLAKYPTTAAYTAATGSFLSRVGPALRKRGLLALPNISIADWATPNGERIWNEWVSYCSGAVQEFYSKWGNTAAGRLTDDPDSNNDWSDRQAFLAHMDPRKIFLGVTYAPKADLRSQRYARASFLSDWSGGPSALIFEPTNPETQDPYASTWTVDIGTPLAERYKVGVAWRRDFTGGTVIVNPSPTAAQTVSLGGAHIASDGSSVSSVTVPATDGVILRTVGGRR